MKKFLLILIWLMPFSISAQNKITLKSGDVFTARVEGFYGENLVFTDVIPRLNVDRVNISEVVSIAGVVPNSRIKAILKKNPEVQFLEENNIEENIVSAPPVIHIMTPGDHLQQAGIRYFTGLGISFGGAVLAVAGASVDEKTIVYAGCGVIITGFIVSLTGHAQLIKAGKKLNQEQISITPASSGIGLSINF